MVSGQFEERQFDKIFLMKDMMKSNLMKRQYDSLQIWLKVQFDEKYLTKSTILRKYFWQKYHLLRQILLLPNLFRQMILFIKSDFAKLYYWLNWYVIIFDFVIFSVFKLSFDKFVPNCFDLEVIRLFW